MVESKDKYRYPPLFQQEFKEEDRHERNEDKKGKDGTGKHIDGHGGHRLVCTLSFSPVTCDYHITVKSPGRAFQYFKEIIGSVVNCGVVRGAQ
jgi:hypothetical protein